jgi:DNA-binding PadR family transcriptional regulator
MADAFKFGVGMLYPLLHKLEKDGFIIGKWEEFAGMRKRVYHLTKKGKKEFATKTREWLDMSDMIGKLVLEYSV